MSKELKKDMNEQLKEDLNVEGETTVVDAPLSMKYVKVNIDKYLSNQQMKSVIVISPNEDLDFTPVVVNKADQDNGYLLDKMEDLFNERHSSEIKKETIIGIKRFRRSYKLRLDELVDLLSRNIRTDSFETPEQLFEYDAR